MSEVIDRIIKELRNLLRVEEARPSANNARIYILKQKIKELS